MWIHYANSPMRKSTLVLCIKLTKLAELLIKCWGKGDGQHTPLSPCPPPHCQSFWSLALITTTALSTGRVLEEGKVSHKMATHSSTLAWKIPWMEGPGRRQSIESLGVGYDWATSLSLFTFMHWRRKWQPTPVFLPGESQGPGAWWAAVYGVTQSRTRLKWLSSSSSSSNKVLVAQSCQPLWEPMDCSPPGSSVPGDSPGKNTGVGCHFLLQGIFPTQGSNLGLLHYRQILYYLSHQRNPRYSLRTGNSYFFISSRVASLYSLKSDIAVFENSQMLLRTQIGDYRKPSAVMLLCVPAHLWVMTSTKQPHWNKERFPRDSSEENRVYLGIYMLVCLFVSICFWWNRKLDKL